MTHVSIDLPKYQSRVWWTIDEVCDYLRCGKTTFHTKYKRHPDFPTVNDQGARTKLYRGADIVDFLERRCLDG